MTPETNETVAAFGLGFDTDTCTGESVTGQTVGQFFRQRLRDERRRIDTVNGRIKFSGHDNIRWRPSGRDRPLVETGGEAPYAFTQGAETGGDIAEWERSQSSQRADTETLEEIDKIDERQRVGVAGRTGRTSRGA